ncbi:hypothetical protein ACJ41O_013022 [Fusarium nematophilum]
MAGQDRFVQFDIVVTENSDQSKTPDDQCLQTVQSVVGNAAVVLDFPILRRPGGCGGLEIDACVLRPVPQVQGLSSANPDRITISYKTGAIVK